MISGAVLVLLHASLRRLDRPLRALPLIYAVVIVGFVSGPVIIQASSTESLKRATGSQDANTDPDATRGTAGSNNLALERVDYSERGAVLTNLPKRMTDVVTRPYPWQLDNASQQLGAAGTLVALSGLVLLIGAAWRRRGEALALTAPILYPTAVPPDCVLVERRQRGHRVSLPHAPRHAWTRDAVRPARAGAVPSRDPALAGLWFSGARR